LRVGGASNLRPQFFALPDKPVDLALLAVDLALLRGLFRLCLVGL
jgi:hypothetical protein